MYQNSEASCRVGDQGVLHVKFPAGARIDLAGARMITAACTTLTRGAPRPAVVDFRKARSINWIARRYFFHDPVHLATYSAVAILVRTEAGRIIGELLSRILRPRKPARLFTSERDAHRWLLQAACKEANPGNPVGSADSPRK
jgi:hypothetical protein